MSPAEMMTLIAYGVDERTLIVAEAAGSVANAMMRAEAKVGDAAHFHSHAKWREVFTLMEGIVEELPKARPRHRGQRPVE